MTDDEHEYRRKNDVSVSNIQVSFNDFYARYERDLITQNDKLEEILKTIKMHDEFIRNIKPVYAKGMMALGAAILGSIGIGVHWLWKHVSWG